MNEKIREMSFCDLKAIYEQIGEVIMEKRRQKNFAELEKIDKLKQSLRNEMHGRIEKLLTN